MSAHPSIFTFLKARIAEREALARAAAAEVAPFTGTPDFQVEWRWALYSQHVSGGYAAYSVRSAYPDTPDDVLADCEAKRSIVATMQSALQGSWQSPGGAEIEVIAIRTLRSLAALFADHPDFDEAWRP